MTTTSTTPTTSTHGIPGAPVAATTLELLDRSRASLLEACCSTSAEDRYTAAHLGALRAAAALLATREGPGRRGRPRNVWRLLPTVAAELAEWAAFFDGSARRRAAIERGAVQVGSREADDLLRQAEAFHELVQATLGLPMGRPLPDFVAPTSAAHRG